MVFMAANLNATPLNPLTAQLVQKPCAFVIQIDFPLRTLELIVKFLMSRKIHVDIIQMHATTGGEAILILHCQVEKDRIKHIQQMIAKIEGIMKVDLLESKKTNIINSAKSGQP